MICLLFLSSCCYRGYRNELGVARKEIKVPSIANEEIYSIIDTTSLYELKYRVTNIDKILIHDPKENLGRYLLKFYSDGKVGAFIIGYDDKKFKYDSSYNISKSDFNPKKSLMGYYYKENNKIKIKQFGAELCKSFINRGEIKIIGDTLLITERRNKLMLNDYEKKGFVKIKVNKKNLSDWQPDW